MDLNGLPYNVIDFVKIKDMTVTIFFKSGNCLQATAPNENDFFELKEDMIKNLGSNKVIEE